MVSNNRRKRCRVCMTPYKSMKVISINSERTGGRPVDLLNYLFSCSIHRLDKLPQSICKICLKYLQKASKLKELFLKSDQKFRKELLQEIEKKTQDAVTSYSSTPSDEFLRLEEGYQTKNFNNFNFVQYETIEIREMLDENSINSIKIEDETIQEVVTIYKDMEEDYSSSSTIQKKVITIKRSQVVRSRIQKEAPQIKEIDNFDLSSHDDLNSCSNDDRESSDLEPKNVIDNFKKATIENSQVKLQPVDYFFERSKKDGKFHCPHCNCTQNRRDNMKTHFLNVHHKRNRRVRPKPTEKNWICDLCGNRFLSKHLLSGHIRFTHVRYYDMDKVQYPHECLECGKRYRTVYSLKNHISLHRGIINEQCSHCDAGFPTRKQLKKHLVSRHFSERISCEFCTTSFKKKEDYKRHLIKTHTDLDEDVMKDACQKLAKTVTDYKQLKFVRKY